MELETHILLVVIALVLVVTIAPHTMQEVVEEETPRMVETDII